MRSGAIGQCKNIDQIKAMLSREGYDQDQIFALGTLLKSKIIFAARLRPHWVSVDHQAKSSFDKREDAEKEVQRIRSAFPKLSANATDVGNGNDGETPA
jgi:hypothetical protein